MRLEITPTEEILLKGLTSVENIWTSHRLNNHTIITSNELFDIWEEYFSNNGQSSIFQSWFAPRSNNIEQLKKVFIESIDNVEGVDSDKDKITISTARSSKDKIVIGIENANARVKNKEIIFITKNNFNNEKKQTVTFTDVLDVLDRRKINMVFDIHETPINLEVGNDHDSSTLAKYLSIFISGTKKLYVKDAYLYELDNQNNLKKYILPLVDKEDCQITLETKWGDAGKRVLEQNLKDCAEYSITLKQCKSEDSHSSFIKTDKYIIKLGYRLKIFGSNNDGKTKAENIVINKL